MSIPVFPEAKLALKGKKALIVGIANEHSIRLGMRARFSSLGRRARGDLS
jgi:enoyl-[acyl-carrier protein] reductase I